MALNIYPPRKIAINPLSATEEGQKLAQKILKSNYSDRDIQVLANIAKTQIKSNLNGVVIMLDYDDMLNYAQTKDASPSGALDLDKTTDIVSINTENTPPTLTILTETNQRADFMSEMISYNNYQVPFNIKQIRDKMEITIPLSQL